jgi:hypothetical protein
MSARESVYCFAVQAEPTPCALPRVLEVFASCGLVPSRCMSDVGSVRDQLVIEVQLAGLSPEQAEHVARRLGRVLTVQSVLWSEKQSLEAA